VSIEQSPAMPIFNEATTLAVRLAVAPVAILTAIAGASYQIASISGLEQLWALPHRPNLSLELAGLEYCHDRAMNSPSCSIVTNFHHHPQLAQSSLLRVYRIQAALGVPITTAAGDKLGTLSIFDFKPRQFNDRDVDLLHLVSRLVASEFERKLLSQAQLNNWVGDLHYPATLGFDDPLAVAEHSERKVAASNNKIEPLRLNAIETLIIDASAAPQVQGQIQSQLLTHLAQELRTPLTSVLGMASVLQQEVYGSLTSKQKDYLGIIHHSGQQLVTLVDEISQLGGFVGDASRTENSPQQLTLKSVNLELMCQLALQSLEPLAQKKQQQIRLALAANTSTTWMLDKDKVRQIVYYLGLSLIHASATDRQIAIEIATFADALQIQIVTDDLDAMLTPSIVPAQQQDSPIGQDLRISLGLTLSHTLAAAHGGTISSILNGSGYQLTLPLPSVAIPATAIDRDAIVTV
jgi:signal transduction histidine kinase